MRVLQKTIGRLSAIIALMCCLCFFSFSHQMFSLFLSFFVTLNPALFLPLFAFTPIPLPFFPHSSRFDSCHSISSHHSLASCSVTTGLVQSSPSMTSGFAALHASCPVRRCVHRQRSGEEVKQARKQVSVLALHVTFRGLSEV